MKKLLTKIFFVTGTLLLAGQLQAQIHNLAWAKSFGGNNPEEGSDIVVDASGNSYTIGQFEGIADFDPGPGTFILTADPNNTLGQRDIYISKLDASGNLIWAKQISAHSGNTYSYKPSIDIDANGDIVYTGVFNGTVDFDPGAGTMMMTGANFDVFVSKISPAGNFIWAKQFAGSMTEVVCGLETDASGNIYTTGYFGDSTDFDPGPAAYKLGTASGYFAIFVSKLNSSGDFVWAKKMGGAAQQMGLGDLGRAITLDAVGNVYVTGAFDGAEDFDPGAGIFTLNAPVNFQSFVLKLDVSGNFVWAMQCGGITNNDYMRASTIAVNASGNVYYSGDFIGGFDFDPGAGTTILSSGTDGQIFISELDPAGNFMWAKAFTGTGVTNQAMSMTLDNASNIYITGNFTNTVDFDPDGTVFNLTTIYTQTFFIKLTANGNFIWVKTFENGNSSGRSIVLDNFQNIYLTGELGDYWTVDFDPDPTATYNLTPAVGYSDAYVCKFSPTDLGVNENEINNLLIYPNPANSILNIQNPLAEKMKLELHTVAGELISTFEMENSGMQIDVSTLSNGMYFLSAETTKGKTVTKIQVAH